MTGDGDDEVDIKVSMRPVYRSRIDLGNGNDLLNLESLGRRSKLNDIYYTYYEYCLTFSSLDAGTGDDKISSNSFKFATYSSINLGPGNDELKTYFPTQHEPDGFAFEDTEIYADEGDDLLYIWKANGTKIDGGEGKDVVKLYGPASDWLIHYDHDSTEKPTNVIARTRYFVDAKGNYTYSQKNQSYIELINVEEIYFDTLGRGNDSRLVITPASEPAAQPNLQPPTIDIQSPFANSPANPGLKGPAHNLFDITLSPGQRIKELLSAIPASIAVSAGVPKDIAPSDGATLNISAPGWSDTISLIRISQAADTGSVLEIRQPEEGFTGKLGTLIVGGPGNDVITGARGWDIVDGAGGDDLIKTGNGRDILQGGEGADELWGAFGWNTYRDERDGFVDRIVIRSDQLLSNHLYGKAGNNPDGSKADVIEGLDANDLIVIQGASTAEITVQADATAHGLSGIGLYAQGYLEALYIGGDLSTAQLQAMVSGDNSQGAIDKAIFSYGNGWLP